MHSNVILEEAFNNLKRKLPKAELEFINYGEHALTAKHTIQIQSKKYNYAYKMEFDLRLIHSSFIGQVRDMFGKAHREIQAKIDAAELGGMYHNPYALTYEEELELQKELERVKSGFYDKVKRDRKGNRMKPEDLDAYKKLDSFGEF
jgi:hypothetical protein